MDVSRVLGKARAKRQKRTRDTMKEKEEADICDVKHEATLSSSVSNATMHTSTPRSHHPSRFLQCPPCRLHESYTFDPNSGFLSTILYAVVPGFFPQTPSTTRIKDPHIVCKPPLRHAIAKTLAAARAEMGAVDDISNNPLLLVAFAAKPSSNSSDIHAAGTMAEIVGLCVAHELSMAYRIHCPHSMDADRTCHSTDHLKCEACDNEDVTKVGDTWCVGSVYCGVQFFWVSESHRRRGIATALVNLARQNVSYGFEVPPEQVAFFEPTANGKEFARKYSGRLDFLIF